MTNPSRESTFYFRRRDGEDYDHVFSRYRDILTWTYYETLQIVQLVIAYLEALAFSADRHTLRVRAAN